MRAWLGVLFLASASSALAANPYLDQLISSARAQKLAEEKQWLRLGHYQPNLLGGYESDVDGAPFFLAANGKTDPRAELEATLAGFFADEPTAPKAQHPQCQFPARFAWLNSKLHFDFTKMRPRACARFQEFWGRLKPKSVTLVFSAYYLNNPSSAFGHTFLRVNKQDFSYSGKRYELLDYGIDYSATVDTGNAIIYAFKGLTGLFEGHFNYYPYFYKVREYNDSESRDLWEYDLNLTPEQVAMLVAHLWELGSSWIDYYYMTENCSFEVLTVLEAANPELDLRARVGAVVIPADTLKIITRTPGLVRGVHFRPSLRRQFEARAKALSSPELEAVAEVSADPKAPLPAAFDPKAQARVFDTAMDYVEFKDAKGILFETDPEAMKREQRLLERRAEIRLASEDVVVDTPADSRPDLGHDSARVGIGGGYGAQTGPFSTLDFRLALHDLADPPVGYPELSQIEFLPTRLRYNTQSGNVWLDDFSLVRVISLSSFDRFNLHPSWELRVGATTVRDGGCNACLAGLARVGGGFSRSFFGTALTAFALGEAELMGSPELQGPNQLPIRPGLGPTVGVRARVTPWWVSLATGDGRWLWEAHPRLTWAAAWTNRFRITSQTAFDVELRAWPQILEASAGILLYL